MLTSYSLNGTLHLILEATEGSLDLHQIITYLNRTLKSSTELVVILKDVPEIEDTFSFDSLDLLFRRTPISKLTLIGQKSEDDSGIFVESLMLGLRETYNYPIYATYLSPLPVGA